MQIMNSGMTMMALGELKKNDTSLGKQLKKVASGMRVNGAGDGASEYAISERMRVQLRALGQDIVNAQTGKALVKTAMGGVENIQDNLREMKAMAINAANDHNTDADRATLQKEFSQRMEQIDDIAATTNYNGKLLLDGHYGILHAITSPASASPSVPSTVANAAANAVAIPDINPNTILAQQEQRVSNILKQSDLAVTGTSPYTMPANAATYTIDSTGRNITITSSGVFNIKSTGGVPLGPLTTITVAASDVVLKGTGSGEYEQQIVVSQPNTHLWIDSVNIANTTHSCLKFTGAGNALMLLGSNLLYCSPEQNTSCPAVLDVGGGLTIYNGSSTSEGTLRVDSSLYLSQAAAIGGSGASASLTIESGTICAAGFYGAAIGGPPIDDFGDITINGGRVYAMTQAGAAAIGAGVTGVNTPSSSVGNITIGKHAIVEAFTLGGSGVGTGNNSYNADSSAKSITIESTNVRFFSYHGEAIGSAFGYPQNPTMVRDKWGFSVPTNPLYTGKIGSISVASGSYLNPFFDKSSNTTRYHYFVGSTFSDDYNNFESATSDATTTTPATGSDDITYTYVWNPLILQTGTKANQQLCLHFKDMHTKAMGLAGTKLVPREAALAALDTLDKAIDYALGESTTLGAYATRLDFTTANLTTANENTQASESTIRDADMAKEMTAYTKASILAQASQAMLAQANQNASSVLSLLQ